MEPGRGSWGRGSGQDPTSTQTMCRGYPVTAEGQRGSGGVGAMQGVTAGIGGCALRVGL